MTLDPSGALIPTSRRACLIVPGRSTRMLEKARSMEVEEVVVDLEDAVAAEQKPRARRRSMVRARRSRIPSPGAPP